MVDHDLNRTTMCLQWATASLKSVLIWMKTKPYSLRELAYKHLRF